MYLLLVLSGPVQAKAEHGPRRCAEDRRALVRLANETLLVLPMHLLLKVSTGLEVAMESNQTSRLK